MKLGKKADMGGAAHHKEEHKKNVKEYLTPERRKEYNKTYSDKKRALKLKESISNDIKN
jgi:hypothetical protein